MMFIETIEEESASPALKELYEKNKSTLGYIANYSKIFSHRPDVYIAWMQLIASIRRHVDHRRYELITLAAAKALKSSYCSLAHGSVLKDNFFSEEELAAISQDFRHASLSVAEVAMMNFAEKIVKDATAITEEDVAELRRHGFSDEEIFDITTVTTARCFFSKTLDALGASADAIYNNLPEGLKISLTVGREIEG